MTVYVIADIKVTDDGWIPDYAASVRELPLCTTLTGSRAAPVGKDRRGVRQFFASAVIASSLRGRTSRTGRPSQVVR